MVTTALAWVAGIALVFVSWSPARFARVLEVITRPQVGNARRDGGRGVVEHPLVRAGRLLALAVGALCVVLAVLGTRTLVG